MHLSNFINRESSQFQNMHQSLEFAVYLNNHITIKSIISKINNSKVIYPEAQISMLSYQKLLCHSNL